jgi:tRNA G10  N-methylase Trm11
MEHYERDGITIYNCDCRRLRLQECSIDSIVTDPSYDWHLWGRRDHGVPTVLVCVFGSL